MFLYSMYLDKQIAKLRGFVVTEVDTYPMLRMGRVERFLHSPLGTLVLAVCFVILMAITRETEKQEKEHIRTEQAVSMSKSNGNG